METNNQSRNNHPIAEKIVRSCKLVWNNDSALQGNCSGFLRSVALKLGVNLEGNANTLCKKFESKTDSSWMTATSHRHAVQMAQRGYLVVATKEEEDRSGHVMIVMPDTTVDGYPKVCGGGSARGRSDGTTKSARDCWGAIAVNQLKYYFRAIPSGF